MRITKEEYKEEGKVIKPSVIRGLAHYYPPAAEFKGRSTCFRPMLTAGPQGRRHRKEGVPLSFKAGEEPKRKQ